MRIINGIDSSDLHLDGAVLSVGNFDGVHRGHQQILAQAGLLAADSGNPLVILTFEPHPLSILTPDRVPPRLAPPEEKFRLLAAAGAHTTVVARSDRALLGREPESFVTEVLVDRFHPSHIVEGVSFTFGRGRRGTPDMLRRLGSRLGFEVFVVDSVRLQVETDGPIDVSSSVIRRLIAAGKVHRAALCLGRSYTLLGTVGRGRARGMKLGFPTINLVEIDQLIPADGVYSGWADVPGGRFAAAISVGHTPTFGEERRQVEAHLVGFEGDLYGDPVRLKFGRPLRPQITFGSVDELVNQLHRDVQAVRADSEKEATLRNTRLPGEAP